MIPTSFSPVDSGIGTVSIITLFYIFSALSVTEVSLIFHFDTHFRSCVTMW